MADAKRPVEPDESDAGQPPAAGRASSERVPPDAFDELRRRRADQSASAQMFALSGVGFEFIAAVGLLTAIGWWVDKTYGTSPWFVLVGVALGFAVGLTILIRFARRAFRSEV